MDLHKIQVSVLRSVELYFNSPTLQTTHRYPSTSSADAQACGIYSTEYTQQGKRTVRQHEWVSKASWWELEARLGYILGDSAYKTFKREGYLIHGFPRKKTGQHFG